MNSFLFCFVLAVGLADQAVTGASNQRNHQAHPAPTGQGNANANSGELVKTAIDDLTKLFTDFGEQVQSTFNPRQFEIFFNEYNHIFSDQTKNKFNKVVSDIETARAQASLSGVSSDFKELIAAAGADISSVAQKYAKEIPNPSEVFERINNFVEEINEPKRN
ncbi:uncharacterized protein LOC123272003 [Cotesia glomerata]|uniref:uncharacterized protein LOC123272003 n=1 Tax=Cotesia glomerata TaxID=32391 RepID=UPI001D009782|nr:uncharacterized protein LOC123272003 [Cotesia glomerata]